MHNENLILYHASPLVNRASIESLGLLTACSKTMRKAIYLVPEYLITWGVSHTMARHHTIEVDIYRVIIPVGWVKKQVIAGSTHNFWYTLEDICPHKITRL